jgi:Leucine-rich repeat (LRR) protein
MKTALKIILIFSVKILYAQELKFESSDFEKLILTNYPEIDINTNKKIDSLEALKVEKLSLMEQNLESVQDIIYFKNLKYLSLTINKITEFEIDGFPNLEELYIARNNLTKFHISNLPSLTELAVGRNNLTEVQIINCPKIESLNLMDNKLEVIDVSQFKSLKYLTIDNNKLKTLDLSYNPDLIQFNIRLNLIKTIDITNNSKLKMNILYMDDEVEIIGSEEQLSKYKKAPVIITN